MKRVSTVEQTRALEQQCERVAGVNSLALMEVAAKGIVDRMQQQGWAAPGVRAMVFCGPGNNGGDGYAVARWLRVLKCEVGVVEVLEARSQACQHQKEAVRRLGIAFHALEDVPWGTFDVIVDAIFGAGLTRPLGGVAASAVAQIQQTDCTIVSVDLPSGLRGDEGASEGPSIKPHCTVMIGRRKPVAYLPPACDTLGQVVDVALGFEYLGQEGTQGCAEVPDWEDLAPLVPHRSPQAHKGDSGHLLVIGGDDSMMGAAVLVCRGAFAAGAGLVTLATPSESWARLRGLPAEVMVVESEGLKVLDGFEGYDAVVAGPGMAAGDTEREEWLGWVWNHVRSPVLFDAGALFAAKGSPEGERLITPHPGEAARLIGTQPARVQSDRMGAANQLGTSHAALLKGRYSLVACPGHPLSINAPGCSALATAGSGDVLAGVAGALLARGLTARDAARVAAHVHGLAGEALASQGREGHIASDLCAPISSYLGAHPG
jgi:hydroxyethylthiazole kinase-like uncharacterized protein yjeF